MKKIILYSIIFISGVYEPASAQAKQLNASSGVTVSDGAHTGKSNKAETYFENGEREFSNQRYMYAIPFYKTALKHPGENDSLASLHIAQSYWHVRNYDSALLYYRKFEAKFGRFFSSMQRIAELSANHGYYKEAANTYKKLMEVIPARNPMLLAERYKGFANTNIFLRDSLDYSVRLLKLNTQQQDFSPQLFRGGMVFVSNRYSKKTSEKEFGWDGLPFANIYWVKDTMDLYTIDTVAGYSSRSSNITAIKANDDYTPRTSNDNDVIMVSGSRTAYNGTIHQLAKFSDDLDTKYNYGPLCFSQNNDKVFFTRNNLTATNGRYNLEICMSALEKGVWSKVRVMPFVKPEYDFYHPALSADGTKLYFCSNKPGGHGGSDIYYVNIGSDSVMSIAYSLDNKINTAGNELFPTVHGDTLYFSSDGLAGLGGLDIYKTYTVRGSWQSPVNIGYPINSSFDDFGIVYNNNKAKGYFSSNRLGTDDIYVFERTPFAVSLKGTVLSKTTMRRLDVAKVVIHADDANGVALDSVVTDLTGNFHFNLRPGRAYTIQVTRNGYFEDSMHITDAGSQRVLALQPILLTPIPVALPTAEPAKENDRDGDEVPDTKDKCPDIKGVKENYGCPDIQARINELAKMVFFKTASAELSPEALKPLSEVADIIKDYPTVTLSIEGHTDNRASAPYNKDLSQRRANSVKSFFVKKGFSADRFTSNGYGLERPIADNNTESGRAMNRRVSIKATFH